MSPDPADELAATPTGPDVAEIFAALRRGWRLLVLAPLAVGLLALGVTYLLKPIYTARTSLLAPQQQQSTALAAIAQLGALSGLAGNVAGVRSPIDQYVSLLKSRAVGERILDAFDLVRVYDKKLRSDALGELSRNARIEAGRRDGMVYIEVDDHDAQRAAAIANRYVEELHRLTNALVLTEAQQRRAFFEGQLEQTKDRLTRAQLALQASGFGAGAFTAEPRAAAERYARLQAQVTSAEVRLQTLLGTLVETAPEVQQQRAQLAALKAQLARTERPTDASVGPDYISKYREFKYQEALFELLARQFEMARVDESREGTLIQVIDVATAPDRRRWPKRALTAFVAAALAAAAAVGWIVVRTILRGSRATPT